MATKRNNMKRKEQGIARILKRNSGNCRYIIPSRICWICSKPINYV